MRFDLDALNETSAHTSADGAPMLLSVEAIDEDPLQPRSEFDPERLQELAVSIAQRGVLQAVSVRRHPDKPERWMLNFGARRLRASKLAGLTQIPAYVNETATSYDQVIENEQREGLKPLELALFVQSRIVLGESQADIARQLGKSQPYITYSMALIDAPDWLMGVYRQGRCRGMAELYHLRQLHAQTPDRVQAWIGQQPSISRSDIRRLKFALGDDAQASNDAGSMDAGPTVQPLPRVLPSRNAAQADSNKAAPAAASHVSTGKVSPTAPSRLCPAASRLFGELDGQAVEIVLDAVPSMQGRIYVRVPNAAETTEVAARDLVLIGFEAGGRT